MTQMVQVSPHSRPSFSFSAIRKFNGITQCEMEDQEPHLAGGNLSGPSLWTVSNIGHFLGRVKSKTIHKFQTWPTESSHGVS